MKKWGKRVYYRLKEPWCLRGYRGEPMVLEKRGESDLPFRLTLPLWRLLSRCDGETEMSSASEKEAEVLKAYEARGVLERTEVPAPIAPRQRFRAYDNRRVDQAFLSLTGRCNLNCLHCFSAAESRHEKPELSLADATRVLDECRDCGIAGLWISGGEPLVHPHFREIVEGMRERELRMVRLYTNGILFLPRTVELLRENGMRPEIVISFDGLGTHDWMRNRPGAERDAERAIRLAAENGFPVKATVNINARTMARAAETARYLYGLGARSLFFIRTGEGPRWLHSGERNISPEEYWETSLGIIESVMDLNRKDLRLVFFNGPTLPPGLGAEAFEKASPWQYDSWDIHDSAWCEKCLHTVFISASGNIYPCDAFEGASVDSGFLTEGTNVLRRPLREILNDSPYARIMRISTEDILRDNPECRGCEWWARCRGSGCRASANMILARETGGTFRNFSPTMTARGPLTCAFYRGGYHDRLVRMLKEAEGS